MAVYHVWKLQQEIYGAEEFVRLDGTYNSRTSANRARRKIEAPSPWQRPPRTMVLQCREEDPCSECRPRRRPVN